MGRLFEPCFKKIFGQHWLHLKLSDIQILRPYTGAWYSPILSVSLAQLFVIRSDGQVDLASVALKRLGIWIPNPLFTLSADENLSFSGWLPNVNYWNLKRFCIFELRIPSYYVSSFRFTHSPLPYIRLPQPNHEPWTNRVCYSVSTMHMIFGTSCQPSLCFSHFW